MQNVLIYGTLSVIPLIIGSYLGSIFRFKEKIIGIIAAFGAGSLIAALTLGLMEESFKMGGYDNAIIGFIIGGIIFSIGDVIIVKIGGRKHKRVYTRNQIQPIHDDVSEASGWGVVLGQTLDGIPESMALGIGLLVNKNLGLLMLLAIFLSNLPEAISSAYDLTKAGRSHKLIIGTWAIVALSGLVFTILGYTVFAHVSPHLMATFEAIAAGAILSMLASTLMPEAYRESGIDSSLATVLGFLVIFIISKTGV